MSVALGEGWGEAGSLSVPVVDCVSSVPRLCHPMTDF